MTRRLALFDLDNTLLAGDSDHAWGEFLISKGLVDEMRHRQENDRFYQQYTQGKLDIHGYVSFTLQAIRQLELSELASLHSEFMDSVVRPMILKDGRKLIQDHKRQGDLCIIITATNSFITTPIAKEFEVDVLLATELQVTDGYYSGKISGTPCYQEGKVKKLQEWLAIQEQKFSLDQCCFYSDSINDLPLLRMVDYPVVVDPDSELEEAARKSRWPIISLR